jgi:hypothetical protein
MPHFKGHFLPVLLLFARFSQVVVSYTYHMMMLLVKGTVPKDFDLTLIRMTKDEKGLAYFKGLLF